MHYTPVNDDPFSNDGNLFTVDESSNAVTRWDIHTNWRKPEPHNKPGIIECVRLRGNLVNDADCTKPGGTGRRPNPQPHSFICEYTEPVTPPATGALYFLLQFFTPQI